MKIPLIGTVIDERFLNHRLKSTSLALMAIHFGVRYLEGPIVHPAVADPRHGFSQRVEDLYSATRVPG